MSMRAMTLLDCIKYGLHKWVAGLGLEGKALGHTLAEGRRNSRTEVQT